MKKNFQSVSLEVLDINLNLILTSNPCEDGFHFEGGSCIPNDLDGEDDEV